MFKGSHEKLDWDYHKMNLVRSKEETLLRLARLKEFGHYLTKFEETGIQYNEQTNLFYTVGENGKVSGATIDAVGFN